MSVIHTPIGNKPIRQSLLAAVQNGTLCHAYLFYGEEGIGKKTMALYFAKAILCEHPTVEGPCGECESCLMCDSMTHPDLFLAPYDKPLPVAAVREIKERSFIKPHHATHKVFVIPNADRMEGPSYNALLKVLEEPPGNTVFLLTASQKASTPQTILSRCIPIMLSGLSDVKLLAALRKITDASGQKLSLAVEHAGGNLGKALQFLENAAYQKAVETAEGLYAAILARDEYRFLMTAQSGIADKAMFTKVNEALMGNLRKELLQKSVTNHPDTARILSLLSVCNDTAARLARPFSLQLLTASYAAAMFTVLRDEKQ